MENLHEWSERMAGARRILCLLRDQMQRGWIRIDLDPSPKGEGKIYTEAIFALALSSPDNTDRYMAGCEIGYRNHERDKKGKLIKVEAYFT